MLGMEVRNLLEESMAEIVMELSGDGELPLSFPGHIQGSAPMSHIGFGTLSDFRTRLRSWATVVPVAAVSPTMSDADRGSWTPWDGPAE